jgi:chemotaxis protein histidine kinase CheA
MEERGVVSVLWVRSARHRYAVSARRIRNVIPTANSQQQAPSLAFLLGAKNSSRVEPGFILTAQIGDGSFDFGVQSVDGIEEASVRPVPSLIATAGPYVGVVLSSDGKATLLIDLPEVAKRSALT